jgi:hypothetical protein
VLLVLMRRGSVTDTINTDPASERFTILITCAGTYDALSERYDQRLIVRAERVVSGG